MFEPSIKLEILPHLQTLPESILYVCRCYFAARPIVAHRRASAMAACYEIACMQKMSGLPIPMNKTICSNEIANQEAVINEYLARN
jgi:hypothetical protein